MIEIPRHWRTRSLRPFETRGAKALISILQAHGKILPDDRVRICKLHPGRHQRAAGAWLWCAYSELFPHFEVVGCIFPLRDVLAASEVSFSGFVGGLEVFPETGTRGVKK